MVGIALVYAILVFIACLLIEQTQVMSLYFGLALLLPIVFLFGAWAALGAGTTWLRVAVFSLLGPLMFVAAVAGVYAIMYSASTPSSDLLGPPRAFAMAVFVSFSFCVACQVPFWFFRFVFGWQFVDSKSKWEQQQVSIRDIFLLTALFAIGFSTPRFAADMYFDTVSNSIQVGYTEFVETEDDEGNVTMDNVVVTEENIEELREKRNRRYDTFRNSLTLAVIVYSVFVAVLALLFVPAVLLTLRMTGGVKGVCFAVAYLVLLYLGLVSIPIMTVYGGFVTWSQLSTYLIGFGALAVAAAMIPLLISRSIGFRLATKRDFAAAAVRRS